MKKKYNFLSLTPAKIKSDRDVPNQLFKGPF